LHCAKFSFWHQIDYIQILLAGVVNVDLCDFSMGFSNFWPLIPVGAVMAGQDRMVFSSPVFWLGLALIPFTALLPDASLKM